MCDDMWTRWPAPGASVRSRSAAGSARSGKGDASSAWIAMWFASGWSGNLFSTASTVSTASSVPGCGFPSGVHWSHGRTSSSASAKSAPTSGSSGWACQTSRIASA